MRINNKYQTNMLINHQFWKFICNTKDNYITILQTLCLYDKQQLNNPCKQSPFIILLQKKPKQDLSEITLNISEDMSYLDEDKVYQEILKDSQRSKNKESIGINQSITSLYNSYLLPKSKKTSITQKIQSNNRDSLNIVDNFTKSIYMNDGNRSMRDVEKKVQQQSDKFLSMKWISPPKILPSLPKIKLPNDQLVKQEKEKKEKIQKKKKNSKHQKEINEDKFYFDFEEKKRVNNIDQYQFKNKTPYYYLETFQSKNTTKIKNNGNKVEKVKPEQHSQYGDHIFKLENQQQLLYYLN
ncbi:hypothetical protein pb186bvf_000506 [Paramecium bursaria]